MTEWEVPATVVRVVDADTIVVILNLGWHISLEQYVRLYGVNAPEPSTDEGKAASAYVEELIGPGDPVTVVSHKLLGETEKYGRVLGSVTVTSNGRDLSTMLLESGHAVPYEES